MPKTKKKKFKSGKIKRHQFKKKIGLSPGFGKPWSAHGVPFRVEFFWENEDESEENFQVHWIECRKFKGEERRFLASHYAKDQWSDRETIESKFVCFYCANFIVANFEKLHINRGFIFPTSKLGNETIRDPIYKIKWTEELARNSRFNDTIEIVMNNSIWHKL